MKTILITGATSFLGSNLVRELEKKRNLRLIKVSLRGDKKKHVDSLDLLDFKKVKAYVEKKKPDVIIHLAALVNLSRDYLIGRKCIDANIIGTINLLEATKNISVRKVLFASTEEIYGVNSSPYTLKQVPKPPSLYSISKVAGEHLCQYYATLHGFSFIIFRIGTLYGPDSQPDRFLTQIIKKAKSNQPILLNSGKRKRDYIYIDDAVDAIVRAVTYRANENMILNIGGKISVSLHTFARTVVRISKSKSKIVLNAFPDRVGEAFYQKMDLSAAKKILGWKPTTDLAVGIKKSIDFSS